MPRRRRFRHFRALRAVSAQLFREGLGRTLHQHYLAQRLRQAARLQRETSLTAAEIAWATGFALAAE